jgi:hypothetical protein
MFRGMLKGFLVSLHQAEMPFINDQVCDKKGKMGTRETAINDSVMMQR